jgi:hemerythrin superfamily protein
MRLDLASAKRQTEFVKQLLADATAEKEIMYETFNEELDEMFSNLQLPDDDKAWPAILDDLKTTKEEKNQLKKEKSCVLVSFIESTRLTTLQSSRTPAGRV